MPNFEVPDFNKLMEDEIGNGISCHTSRERLRQTLPQKRRLILNNLMQTTFNETYRKIVNENLRKSFQFSFGSFAVSGETYYMESGQKLFRWKPGTTQWSDTGLADETESGHFSGKIDDLDSIGFRIAVSGRHRLRWQKRWTPHAIA